MRLTVLDTNQQVFIHQAEVILERFQFRYSLAKYPLELAALPLKSNEGTESSRNFVSEIVNKLVVSPSLAPASSDLSKRPTIGFMFWGRLAVPMSQGSSLTTVATFEIVFLVSTSAFTWLWKHYKDNFNIIVEMELENKQKIRLDGFTLLDSTIKESGIPKYKMTIRHQCHAQFLTSKSDLKASLKVEVELKDSIINLSPVPDHRVLNKDILLSQIHCDFKIITEDDQVLLCHKIFLAARSKVFSVMFSTACEETTNNQVKLPISRGGAVAFLKYLYYSDVEAPIGSPTLAMDLLELGHKYDIPPLEMAMKKILLGNKNWWYSADNALRLFDWSCKVKDHVDLKEKAVDVIRSKVQELMGSDRFQQIFPNYVGAELCLASLQSSSDSK